ncbi:MAG TPA: rod shape-determining protein MreD [Blastocatellia bacterium]|nr:rod shape-determining protein MreD [Blastocatellia bacterium]
MQTFKIALSIIVALLVQLVAARYLQVFKYVDLQLVVTVYVALQRALLPGLVTGFASGLCGDAISGGILGIGGFSKTLIGYLVAMISIKFSFDNPLARLGVVAVASAVNTAIYVSLTLVLEQPLPFVGTWGEFGKTTGWRALADSAASIVVFVLMDRLFSEQVQARRMAIKKRFYD